MGQENGSKSGTSQHHLGVCASVSATLGSVGLEVLFPIEQMLPSGGYNWSPTKLKSIATTWLVWYPLARKPSITVVTMMVSVIDPTHYETEGLLLHNYGRDEYLQHSDNTLGHLLLLSYPVLTVNV